MIYIENEYSGNGNDVDTLTQRIQNHWKKSYNKPNGQPHRIIKRTHTFYKITSIHAIDHEKE